MIFEGKSTREIQESELRLLITDHVAESLHLEFKREPYPSTDVGTKELIKDVTAFANAEGGYIVIGIAEDGGCRAERFLNISDVEAIRRSIIDRCLMRIEPRANFDVGTFRVEGNSALVVHVPESGQKPHCAKPDAEHHYFWRRYEDGVKLMTPAEIRECLNGDHVHRELVQLRRAFDEHARKHIVALEAEMEIHEGNLFVLQSDDKFLLHINQQFMTAIGDRPYYRLWATPTPINHINLRDKRLELLRVLQHPPTLRPAGWDITPIGGINQSPIGLLCENTDYHHLRLLWNGHLEHWSRADDIIFHWDEFNAPSPWVLLFPYAIIEPIECFSRLTKEICQIANYQGDMRFCLGLYNIRGQRLLPGSPGTFGYMYAQSSRSQPNEVQPFKDEHLISNPATKKVENIPDEVAWHLASQVYYRFGYADDQIPLFDGDHHCVLSHDATRGGQ